MVDDSTDGIERIIIPEAILPTGAKIRTADYPPAGWVQYSGEIDLSVEVRRALEYDQIPRIALTPSTPILDVMTKHGFFATQSKDASRADNIRVYVVGTNPETNVGNIRELIKELCGIESEAEDAKEEGAAGLVRVVSDPEKALIDSSYRIAYQSVVGQRRIWDPSVEKNMGFMRAIGKYLSAAGAALIEGHEELAVNGKLYYLLEELKNLKAKKIYDVEKAESLSKQMFKLLHEKATNTYLKIVERFLEGSDGSQNLICFWSPYYQHLPEFRAGIERLFSEREENYVMLMLPKQMARAR